MMTFLSDLSTTDAAAFSDQQGMMDRISTLKFLIEHLALSLGDAAELAAASHPEDWTTKLTDFSQAAQDAIQAEQAAFGFLSDMAGGAALPDPETIQKNSDLLATTIELVAMDLSNSADRLVQESPGIVANLDTFTKTVEPALSGLSGVVTAFDDMAMQSRLPRMPPRSLTTT